MNDVEIKKAYSELSKKGYTVITDLIPKKQLAQLNESLQKEFLREKLSNELFKGGGRLAGHLNCFPGRASEDIFKNLIQSGANKIVDMIDETWMNKLTVGTNFNLPGSVIQHYHFDGIFQDQYLIVNVALVDTNNRNGAIELAPRTHKEFLRFWQFVAKGLPFKGLRIPLNQGDVLIRYSTLWHRGMPNKTKNARPMLAFTLGERNAVQNPFMKNNGNPKFFNNWYMTHRLGRIREFCYIKIPFFQTIFRILRSLLSDYGRKHG